MSSNSIFSKAITRDVPRSAFDRNYRHKTSFNASEIVPIYLDQKVLAHDTVTLDLAYVIRSGTPIAPVMDDAKVTIAFFFVPMRILWEHTKQFYGENDTAAWTQTHEYSIPTRTIGYDDDEIEVGSVGHYMGLPLFKNRHDGIPADNWYRDVSELPLRAYHFICNEWYNNEAVDAPTLWTKGDNANSGISYADHPRTSCKFRDFFTSVLPSPQKGESVLLPLGKLAPIVTGDPVPVSDLTPNKPMSWINYSLSASQGTYTAVGASATTSGKQVVPGNLYADLSRATAATVNQLYLAIATQQFLETDARAGTRFREFMYAHYGATNAGADDIPQLICVKEFDLNVNQVLGTGDNNTGNTGAYSHTSDYSSYFTYSATEPGILMGLATVRTVNTYSQGIGRDWTANGKFDQYYPEFAHIGEQPVYKEELFIHSTNQDKNGVFGYQEAFAEYRYPNSGRGNMTSGYLDCAGANSLDYWTYQQVLVGTPYLNKAFIHQSRDVVDRTLKAKSTTHNYVADFYFKARWVRPMPMYSIPGLNSGI